MTPEERKEKIRALAYEVESEVSYQIDSIVSDAVRNVLDDMFGDAENETLSVSLALAFLCQTDPENQEFSRIDIDKAKMKDLLTRANQYLNSIGDLNVCELKRRLP
jgi:hypothetical protein